MNVAKLEIVLQDDHADLAKEMILKTARTLRQKGRRPCLRIFSG